ncbi:lysin A [Mycobacterium phage TBond007]|uniref:Lysin A n=1 Tax=Mycobacterium phage TBond007 TaxID=1897424 RepID=A0A1D8ERY6_9CAUD|nr:lysin A [Mycobacterium phage TBond007]
MITRANVEAAKALVVARLGDRYAYGGMFSPTNLKQGTDCSGVWNDVLGMAVGRFQWGREAEGATTESYRYIPVGGVGPFGTVRVASPADIPANAVAKLAFHHEGNGGASSHMWGELDGMRIESASDPKGLCTAPTAWEITNPYANAWAYLPGPIVEDGSTPTTVEPGDTLYADVSEWQVPVSDAYLDAGYRVICIRSNDGTYRDKNWQRNYPWAKAAADDGRLAFFLVYFVWRPNWQAAVDTLKSQVGVPHPRMAVMIDVESWGGQITGDQSDGINAAHAQIAEWLGDARRVIGYGNTGDLNNLWPRKPDGLRLVLAAYGSNPGYPGKIAHQYTNGGGFGGGLPEGAPPFGNCDMNSADGYTATAFAAALGIETNQEDGLLSALTPDEQREVLTLLRWLAAEGTGELRKLFPHRSMYATGPEGDTFAGRAISAHAFGWDQRVEASAMRGEQWAIDTVRQAAAGTIWGVRQTPDAKPDPFLVGVAQTYLHKLAEAGVIDDPTAQPPVVKPPVVEQPPVVTPQPPVQKVTCGIGPGPCVLVANGGDGTCALAGNECVLKKGSL